MAKYLILGIIAALPYLALALPEDRERPIDISADSAVLNEKENRAEYFGNVILTQGTFELKGEKVQLITNADGEVKSLISKGDPAKFKNLGSGTDLEPIRGTGKQITYNYNNDTIHISGDALIETVDSRFSGPEITYNLISGKVTASGDKQKRVNMTMQLKNK
tara:strand:+ start:29 stop:517 length:489 start_codon:yes stop_codon:yes gene_type:complete